MSANYELIAIIAIGVTLIGFMWNLHRDMSSLNQQIAGLRERMARLEGLLEGFTGRKEPQK